MMIVCYPDGPSKVKARFHASCFPAFQRNFSLKVVEPGIVEARCLKCKARFETDTTMQELAGHLMTHNIEVR